MPIKNQKNAMFIGESLARSRRRRRECWGTMRRVGMLVKEGVGTGDIRASEAIELLFSMICDYVRVGAVKANSKTAHGARGTF